jgi:hypothetical protein
VHVKTAYNRHRDPLELLFFVQVNLACAERVSSRASFRASGRVVMTPRPPCIFWQLRQWAGHLPLNPGGYSTIWLACAVAEAGGHVETIEADAAKVALATANFERAGVTGAPRSKEPWLSMRRPFV